MLRNTPNHIISYHILTAGVCQSHCLHAVSRERQARPEGVHAVSLDSAASFLCRLHKLHTHHKRARAHTHTHTHTHTHAQACLAAFLARDELTAEL